MGAPTCATPPEGAPPIAKWITTRQPGSGRDLQVRALPVSAAADLANNPWAAGRRGAVPTSATLRSLARLICCWRKPG